MTDLTDQYLRALQDALLSGEQADMDGCRVKVSRQACEQAAAVITALSQREAEAVAGAIEAAAKVADRFDLSIMSTSDADMAARMIAATIRTMHTDATRAALDRVRAEGMREAAGRVAELEKANASLQYALAQHGIGSTGSIGLPE